MAGVWAPLGRLIAAGGFFALSACVVAPPASTPPTPPDVAQPSAESVAQAAYYQRLQTQLLTQGLMRTDGGGPDTPFSAAQLAENFVRIALFDEYNTSSGVLRAQATASHLRRWEQPITMSVEFGATVPMADRIAATQEVRTYAQRLSRLTGVPIRFGAEPANYHVMFLGEDDRRAFAPRLRDLIPGISQASVRAVTALPRDQLCIVIGSFGADGVTYDTAVALIRAEHPAQMRLSCIHEELAQGMGLANDSPRARPSIFNDDEEFGLLTHHDELLLKMLYDPRFSAGMTAAEAAPIARQIATEYLAGAV